jgi:hypothetical protein
MLRVTGADSVNLPFKFHLCKLVYQQHPLTPTSVFLLHETRATHHVKSNANTNCLGWGTGAALALDEGWLNACDTFACRMHLPVFLWTHA